MRHHKFDATFLERERAPWHFLLFEKGTFEKGKSTNDFYFREIVQETPRSSGKRILWVGKNYFHITDVKLNNWGGGLF